jgi:fructan beta-fructosidase
MSSPEYAGDVPTAPWRSAMSLPRELVLRDTPEGLRLVQEPAYELKKLRGKHHRLRSASFAEASEWLARRKLSGELVELKVELALAESHGEFAIVIGSNPNEETAVRRSAAGILSLDRRRSGRTDFHRRFPGIHEALLPARDGTVSLHLFLDTSSIEVFGNDGDVALTDLILPTGNTRDLKLIAPGPGPRVRQIDVWELNSVWR